MVKTFNNAQRGRGRVRWLWGKQDKGAGAQMVREVDGVELKAERQKATDLMTSDAGIPKGLQSFIRMPGCA